MGDLATQVLTPVRRPSVEGARLPLVKGPLQASEVVTPCKASSLSYDGKIALGSRDGKGDPARPRAWLFPKLESGFHLAHFYLPGAEGAHGPG